MMRDWKKHLDYIFTYYKWAILGAGLILWFIFSMLTGLYRSFHTSLYISLVNISSSESLEKSLTDGFLHFLTEWSEEKKSSYRRIDLSAMLYLPADLTGENLSYAEISKTKILSGINAKNLDIVLMDETALQYFTESDLLLSLPSAETASPARSPEDLDALQQWLNQYGFQNMHPSFFALDVSDTDLFSGFSGKVYVGIIANTPRLKSCLDFCTYLLIN